jgi:hypothetical protein
VLKLATVLNEKVLEGIKLAGATVRQLVGFSTGADSPDDMVEISIDDATITLAIERKRRAPYPHEIENLRSRHQLLLMVGTPTLLAPRVSEGQAKELTVQGWSWADDLGNFDLRTRHVVLRNWACQESGRESRRGRLLPHGARGLRIVRTLIGEMPELAARTSSIASKAKVSDARTSQVMAQLQRAGTVQKRPDGAWDIDRKALLELFLDDYPGPGGDRSYFYTLDLLSTSRDLVSNATGPIALSGDIAADLLVPYRRPTHAVIYVNSNVPLDGLVKTNKAEDANLTAIRPWDTSVFPIGGDFVSPLPLAEVTQIAWDLKSLGGSDRAEHLQRMKEWILRPR